MILSETEPAVAVFSGVLKVYAEEIHRAFQPRDTTTPNMIGDLLATELAKIKPDISVYTAHKCEKMCG
jgi:hypothetical protein